MNAVWDLPVWGVIIVVLAALATGYAVLRTVLLAIDRAYGQFEDFLIACYERVTGGASHAAWSASKMAGSCVKAILLFISWPLRRLHLAVRDRVFAYHQRVAEANALRREWETNYKDQFSTFAEFKAAYDRVNDPSYTNDPPPEKSAFAEACEIFDLPVDGKFTREELNKSYKSLIHKFHPEKQGSHGLAIRINGARATIEKEKGWA